jgi:hypothetical protein
LHLPHLVAHAIDDVRRDCRRRQRSAASSNSRQNAIMVPSRRFAVVEGNVLIWWSRQ